MKVDVLEKMFATRSSLTEMIIRLAPQNPEQEAQMRQLVTLRDRVTSAVNHAVERGFEASTADLERVALELDGLNKQLDEAKTRVEGLKTGLEIANKVLSAVAAVISFVV